MYHVSVHIECGKTKDGQRWRPMQVGRLKKPLSAVSGDFKLRSTFKNKKQSIISFQTITLSVSLTTLSKRDYRFNEISAFTVI